LPGCVSSVTVLAPPAVSPAPIHTGAMSTQFEPTATGKSCRLASRADAFGQQAQLGFVQHRGRRGIAVLEISCRPRLFTGHTIHAPRPVLRATKA
jgi:hypothetical protein